MARNRRAELATTGDLIDKVLLEGQIATRYDDAKLPSLKSLTTALHKLSTISIGLRSQLPKEVPSNNTPVHVDGPDETNCAFWNDGVRTDLNTKEWAALNLLWRSDEIDFASLAEQCYGNDDTSAETLKTLIKRLCVKLTQAGRNCTATFKNERARIEFICNAPIEMSP